MTDRTDELRTAIEKSGYYPDVVWGAVGRIDLEPAGCADPECEADHGYTGVVTSDDYSLRVSAAAEGPEAVANLLGFADALSARTAG